MICIYKVSSYAHLGEVVLVGLGFGLLLPLLFLLLLLLETLLLLGLRLTKQHVNMSYVARLIIRSNLSALCE